MICLGGVDPLFLFNKRRKWPQGRPNKLDAGIKSHTNEMYLNNEGMTEPLIDYNNVFVYLKCISIARNKK